MNSTPPFCRESVSQLPKLVARERVNAGDAVRGIAIQCRILEASFPPLTPLTQVLAWPGGRLTAVMATTSLGANAGVECPVDRAGVLRSGRQALRCPDGLVDHRLHALAGWSVQLPIRVKRLARARQRKLLRGQPALQIQ